MAGTDRREQLIAANVDTLFVVSSCNQDFNEARIERYLAIAHEAEVMAVVVLTKADLVDDASNLVSAATRLSPGLLVEAVNALDRDSLKCLDPWPTPASMSETAISRRLRVGVMVLFLYCLPVGSACEYSSRPAFFG